MIAYLKGKVLAVTADSVIVENNGIGYEVFCSGKAFSEAQTSGEIALYTYLQVKEDGLTLFGFSSPAEKQIFLDLISVSGVGPKLGIGILSGMPADDVARAIASADVKRLSSIKGLGKKTAEKIVLELHGKISASELISADEPTEKVKKDGGMPAFSPSEEDAVAALMTLGFSRAESQNGVKAAKERGAQGVEEIIRIALTSI